MVKGGPGGNSKAVGVGGAFFDRVYIEKLVQSLHTKAILVKAGLEDMTPSDVFAYSILTKEGWF